MNHTLKLLIALVTFAAIPYSQAVIVQAQPDSYSGGSGTGFDTGISLTTGQSFSASASVLDLWSAGPPKRVSNANGLNGDIFAVAGDDSGQPVGTHIGENFGLYATGDGSFHYGSLVGRVGTTTGSYFKLGTSYSGNADATGNLFLFYWDSNAHDNSGEISVNINVPDQGGLILSLMSFGLLAFFARFRNCS